MRGRKGRSGGDGRKAKWKLSYINTKAMSRGVDELIGKFNMAAGDVISIRGRLWSIRTFQQELKESWQDLVWTATGRGKLSEFFETSGHPF